MEIKWRKAFMEVTLRAFRRLHIEYGMWGIGQGANKVLLWENLNVGHGVELSPETAVCSAISQEFINSPFTNGIYIDPADNEVRKYEIDREVTLENNRIDLFINRYKKAEEVVFYKYPVIIEAKRAHYFTPDIATGERGAQIEKITGENGLRSDLARLREFREKIKSRNYNICATGYQNQDEENRLKDAFLYLLFWGISSQDQENHWKNTPFLVAEQIEGGLKREDNFELKWMPLKWKITPDKGDSPPSINEWLWIMLLEVDANLIGKPPLTAENWFRKR